MLVASVARPVHVGRKGAADTAESLSLALRRGRVGHKLEEDVAAGRRLHRGRAGRVDTELGVAAREQALAKAAVAKGDGAEGVRRLGGQARR